MRGDYAPLSFFDRQAEWIGVGQSMAQVFVVPVSWKVQKTEYDVGTFR
ncbi:MAG: hypothetical protein NPIRA02_31880 [Nitrospirales bacterium]|nr:MAG: hypothetical protein NPIRA02_31880 [Nitrospirales bacterium]